MPSVDVKRFKGISSDSRKVQAGWLFAALSGTKQDGKNFIQDAAKNGAIGVLAQTGTLVPDGIELIADENPRHRFAQMAAEFYTHKQPDTVVAVTGTNGKSSTVHFVRQLWEAIGYNAASLGTLGVHGTNIDRDGSMTTPDPATLHETLAELKTNDIDHLAMEASSHGLDQYRLDGVKIAAAGFTNLTHDHLDYHGDMSAYRAAKIRLFSDILQQDGIAVLNADSDDYQTFEDAAIARGVRILSYGEHGKAIQLDACEPLPHGQDLRLEILGRHYDVVLPMVGKFQTMNALCALGLAIAENPIDHDRTAKLVAALENLNGAAGRLQLVGKTNQGASVYVDYAHTPDGLKTVLESLRPHTDRNLVCVFGCGGDRDATKRPIMGRIAATLADSVFVTDDNPRTEDAAKIRQAILAECPNAIEIGNRREAIAVAIKLLDSGDVLVIAGKGHEKGQIIGTAVEPFDDVEEAKKCLS